MNLSNALRHTEGFDLRAFFALKKGLSAVGRNKKTKHYNYADLNAINESIAGDLGDRWIFQDLVDGLLVITRLYDLESESLEFIESKIRMTDDLDGQDTGKLVTYYRRYNRIALLDLKTEDNDAASPKRAATRSRRTRRTRVNED